MTEKLIERYKKSLAPILKDELKLSNVFETPRFQKVVVSVGIGNFKESKEIIEKTSAELARITGQKPKLTLSKRAVSAFKLRIGQPVGLTVTLRRQRMFDFLDKLINTALPRVRDFRGLSSRAFDGQGNYTLGIREYTIFPEVRYENIGQMFGLEITIKTTAVTDKAAKVLLVALGFPFEKK